VLFLPSLERQGPHNSATPDGTRPMVVLGFFDASIVRLSVTLKKRWGKPLLLLKKRFYDISGGT